MMCLPRLQYISNGKTYYEQYRVICEALDAGVQWIQLRWKNAPLHEIEHLAEKIKLLCDTYRAVFIVNDYPAIAARVDATGVHLGLTDASVMEARKILKPYQWIGGTANTWQEVMQRIQEQVTYIGLGPLRFTTTKEKLSPVLGIEGYQNILSQLKGNTVPIYAIGGVRASDIVPLRQAGVYGVAISSAIDQSTNKKKCIQQLNQLLYGSLEHCG